MNKYKERIISQIIDHQEVVQELSRDLNSIFEAAELMISTLLNGQKILICGNGGSASDAEHFAAELIGRFRSSLCAIFYSWRKKCHSQDNG